MSKIEAIKTSNKPTMENLQQQSVTLSENALKNKFLSFIQQSFYENADNRGKEFVIDSSNITAIRECFEWSMRINKTKGIFLCGDYGVGKSAIIEGLYKFYIDQHYQTAPTLLRPIYRTANRIASYFRDGDEVNINICKTTPMLFIPEIGRETLKVFDNKPVEEIISERYDCKRTIVSSCNDIRNLPYGDYIYERIYHMCTVIEMRGESKR